MVLLATSVPGATTASPEILFREQKLRLTAPLYLRDGDQPPGDIDPERIIWIRRVYVDEPDREEEKPLVQERAPAPAADPSPRWMPLDYPDLGLA
jgi:hypothetical protein